MNKHFVRVLINDDDGYFLAIAENRKDRIIWNFPGGTVEKGENPRDAAIREIREELNIEISEIVHLYDEQFVFDGTTWTGSFFRALEFKNKPRINEPHKCVGYAYFHRGGLKNLDCHEDVLIRPIEKLVA